MDVTAVAVVAATVFVWGVSRPGCERADLTAPIVFVVVGAVLAGLGLVDAPSAPETLKPLVEMTLVWVLFSDAARIRVPELRQDLGRCVRLLGVGLPLTVLAGVGTGALAPPRARRVAGPARRRGAGPHRRGAGRAGGDEHRRCRPGSGG